uniref:ATP synthase complex subunit 8 n=1 Tax=Zenarchopterus buffonis TaxID=293900 RepID=A0A6M4ST80_9TELE|nr:ATP synthase F0 subunit 8 [Zenarchopterus buffonis]
MPQLNPTPWFFILLMTWIVFLTIIPPKIMAHVFPNNPYIYSTKKTKTESWNWPWH